MWEFYVIFIGKIYRMLKFYMTFAQKNTLSWILGRQMLIFHFPISYASGGVVYCVQQPQSLRLSVINNIMCALKALYRPMCYCWQCSPNILPCLYLWLAFVILHLLLTYLFSKRLRFVIFSAVSVAVFVWHIDATSFTVIWIIFV